MRARTHARIQARARAHRPQCPFVCGSGTVYDPAPMTSHKARLVFEEALSSRKAFTGEGPGPGEKKQTNTTQNQNETAKRHQASEAETAAPGDLRRLANPFPSSFIGNSKISPTAAPLTIAQNPSGAPTVRAATPEGEESRTDGWHRPTRSPAGTRTPRALRALPACCRTHANWPWQMNARISPSLALPSPLCRPRFPSGLSFSASELFVSRPSRSPSPAGRPEAVRSELLTAGCEVGSRHRGDRDARPS